MMILPSSNWLHTLTMHIGYSLIGTQPGLNGKMDQTKVVRPETERDWSVQNSNPSDFQESWYFLGSRKVKRNFGSGISSERRFIHILKMTV